MVAHKWDEDSASVFKEKRKTLVGDVLFALVRVCLMQYLSTVAGSLVKVAADFYKLQDLVYGEISINMFIRIQNFLVSSVCKAAALNLNYLQCFRKHYLKIY